MFRLLLLTALTLLGSAWPAELDTLRRPPVLVSTTASLRFPVHRGDGKLHNPARCGSQYDSYARKAQQIWECVASGDGNKFRYLSPDGKSTLTAQFIDADREGLDEPTMIDLNGAIGRLPLKYVQGVGAEFVWRSDSRALFINVSDGGINATYDAIVVAPFGGKLAERDISGIVRRRFGDPMKCGEAPNIGAVGWLPNGHVLVAAEIVHHSFCNSYGMWRAYEVDPQAMQIIRDFDQVEAKRRFGATLGTELRNAPDICVTKPARCTVDYRRDHGSGAY